MFYFLWLNDIYIIASCVRYNIAGNDYFTRCEFCKKNIQYIDSPNGKSDIWTASCIAFSLIAVIYGVITEQIKGDDTIAYLSVLGILVVIM